MDLSWREEKNFNETTASDYSSGSQPWQVLVTMTTLYSVILFVGCVGNISVIWVIFRYCSSMRTSVMNIYILNMAIADLALNICGIPDVVQFLMAKGWVLGLAACKSLRYIMVVSLYVSILSLLTITIERSVAILSPLKAHSFLTRGRITIAVSSIWLISTCCAIPTAIFDELKPIDDGPYVYCGLALPKLVTTVYKFVEFAVFFAIPLIAQVIMYILICRRLNKSTQMLKKSIDATAQLSLNGFARDDKERLRKSRKTKRMFSNNSFKASDSTKSSNTVESRRRVVRMLTACVVVYFASYTPAQIFLFYETFSDIKFINIWVLRSAMYTLGFINASANPIIYCIFSTSYRNKFAVMYGCVKETELRAKRLRNTDSTLKSGGSLRTISTGAKADGNVEMQQLNKVEEIEENR